MRSIGRIPGALVVWIVSYLLFLSSLANNLSASHDSIHYLIDILQGKELFHQHHLLYNILASKWILLFPGVAPQYAIESFTALWGSSVLAMAYHFFRQRFYLMPFMAAAGTAVIGFSYGVWFYSVNIEVYMPPLFFILASLYVITKKNITQRDVLVTSLLHSLAILFHQVNILFSFVVLYRILGRHNHFNTAAALLRYCLAGIIITGGMYFIAGWFFEGHNSIAGWTHWMVGYTVGHGYWQPLSFKTPLHVATGISHAFVGGHFIFQIPLVEQAFQRSFSEHGLTDEFFLSSGISPAMAWALTALTFFLAALLVLLVIRFIRHYRAVVRQSGEVVGPMLLTLAVYSVFFCFWMPEILEFWILQTVLIWMLLVGMMPLIRFPFRLSPRGGLVIIAMILFSVNFLGSLYWLQDIHRDWYYQEAGRIGREAGPDDLVVVHDEWILKDFVRYYTKATVLATDEPEYTQAGADKTIAAVLSRGGKVFIYRDHQFTRSY